MLDPFEEKPTAKSVGALRLPCLPTARNDGKADSITIFSVNAAPDIIALVDRVNGNETPVG